MIHGFSAVIISLASAAFPPALISLVVGPRRVGAGLQVLPEDLSVGARDICRKIKL